MSTTSMIDPPKKRNTVYVMLGTINLAAFASMMVFVLTL